MHRHIERLLVATLLGISTMTLSGCSKAQQMEESEAVKNLPLVLSISERQERLMVFIANKSPDPIVINGLMRPNGKVPELTFYFDGERARFNTSSHAFVEPQDLSGAAHSLGTEEIHGVAIRKSDLLSMFDVEKGSCKVVQVIYKDALKIEGAYVGELVSNRLELCL